jgi:hypothetical protein
MWIILLDRSGSMAEPFAAGPEDVPAGRVRETEAETKWQAAKSAVLDEVGSFGGEERICLISFGSTASVAFEGYWS